MMDGRVCVGRVNCRVYSEGQWIPRPLWLLDGVEGSGSRIYQPDPDAGAEFGCQSVTELETGGRLRTSLFWERLKW